jgi:hypothetical protein
MEMSVQEFEDAVGDALDDVPAEDRAAIAK